MGNRDSYNKQIAERLEEVARILNEQNASFYRVEAYRKAARTIRNLDRPASEVGWNEGVRGLEELPCIGRSIAGSIHQLVTIGSLPMLERLRGESDPVVLLRTVPGIGKFLAVRIHEDLGIDNLEDLEAAAYDGRLQNIEGFGEKRLAAIRDSLSSRLNR